MCIGFVILRSISGLSKVQNDLKNCAWDEIFVVQFMSTAAAYQYMWLLL